MTEEEKKQETSKLLETLPFVPRMLHGYTPPPVVYEKEQAWHRESLYLKAQGWSNARIAEHFNVSPMAVSIVVRQPWFVQELVRLLHTKGEKEVEKVLEAIAKDAIAVAQEVMHNPNAGDKLRAECAFKFIQAHRGNKIVVENIPTDLKKLQEEENRLRKEIDDLKEINRVQDAN